MIQKSKSPQKSESPGTARAFPLTSKLREDRSKAP